MEKFSNKIIHKSRNQGNYFKGQKKASSKEF